MEFLSILATLGAVLLGYWLGNRESTKQVNKLRDSLYSELLIIEDDMVAWLKNGLVPEYRTPQRNDYTYSQSIDWEYLDSIQRSLGSNMLPQHRRLFQRLKSYYESLSSNTDRRNQKATKPSGEVVFVDYKLTAHVIVQASKMLYFISKALSEREHFVISTQYDMYDVMISINKVHSCEMSDCEIRNILQITGYSEA
ncbi:hypothetical protein ACEWA3_22955 [Vibrio parahaemolyticus]